MKSQQQKEILLEQLKKTPIVQIACEKTNIGRATYYRWMKDDKEFAQKAEEALQAGSLMVNDMAESQLMSAIRDKNMAAIIFWLKHHHPTYGTKIEINGHIKASMEELTPEQETLIKRALKLAALSDTHDTITTE